MTNIKDKQSLEKEILRLKFEISQKEIQLNNQFEKVAAQLEPAELMKSGFSNLFKSNLTSKTLVTTGLSLLTGFLIERVILRKSNVLVKYGIAQIAMTLVSQLADQNWQPEIMLRIKTALNEAIQNSSEENPEKNYEN